MCPSQFISWTHNLLQFLVEFIYPKILSRISPEIPSLFLHGFHYQNYFTDSSRNLFTDSFPDSFKGFFFVPTFLCVRISPKRSLHWCLPWCHSGIPHGIIFPRIPPWIPFKISSGFFFQLFHPWFLPEFLFRDSSFFRRDYFRDSSQGSVIEFSQNSFRDSSSCIQAGVSSIDFFQGFLLSFIQRFIPGFLRGCLLE